MNIIDVSGYDPKAFWKNAHQALVPLSSMSDAHLRNALRYVYRCADAWTWHLAMVGPGFLMGEHAQDAFNDEVGQYAELAIVDPGAFIMRTPLKVIAEGLLEEWARRSYYPNTWWAATAMYFGPARRVPHLPTCDCMNCSIAGEPTH